jgi:hypothetical protein
MTHKQLDAAALEPAGDKGGRGDVPPGESNPDSSRVMRLVMDHKPYEFLGFGRTKSKCRVRVFAGRRAPGAQAPPMVVVVTELEDNPGTSVTLGFGVIATLMLPELVPDPELRSHIIWLEHSAKFDTFDAVTFSAYDKHGPFYQRNKWGSGFSGGYWHRLSRAHVEELIGEAVQL